jgi:glycosyltransferase involved in cell wall biosynthesis
MRILQLAPVWETVPPPGYGGTESVVSVLTEELVRRGHQVTLCASGDSRTSGRLHSVVPASLRPSGRTEDALQYALVHVALSLQHAGEYDVIHNHNGPPADIAMALCPLVETPMLTTLHNTPADDGMFIWQNYTGWYNAISHRQADLLPPLHNAKFAGVVHNAIEVESFPFRRSKDDYVFFMARMAPEKAPHLAIEAAERAGLRLVLAGKISAPEERAYFDSKIAPLLERNDRLIYVGEADARLKRELYAGARAQLVPLLWEEPFGLVAIEAMACGTPVIAFRRGAMPEIIGHEETGFLVDDVDGMVAALQHIDAIDPGSCRAWVEDRFSPGAATDRYLQIYKSMLAWKEVPLDGVSA